MTEFELSFTAKSRTHPNAYRRKDGKTKCPDCHAMTLDATALESLPCVVPPRDDDVPKMVEKPIISPLPPPNAMVGDIWIDTSHVVRMLVLDRPDEEGPEIGLWVDIINREGSWRQRGVAVHAPWKQGYNPEVKQVGLTQEVTHFKSIKDIEQQFYEMEMLKALDHWLDDNHMLAVTKPQFDLEQNISKPSATLRTEVMARPIPEPIIAEYTTQLKVFDGQHWVPIRRSFYNPGDRQLKVFDGEKYVPVNGYSPTGHPIIYSGGIGR
jgi:hypothetical protein